MGILARIRLSPDCNAGQQKEACNTRPLDVSELFMHKCMRCTEQFTVVRGIRKPQITANSHFIHRTELTTPADPETSLMATSATEISRGRSHGNR